MTYPISEDLKEWYERISPVRSDINSVNDTCNLIERIARLEQERNDTQLLLMRVASIHDGKPHNKWVRNLGIEARHLADKYGRSSS
jgi:hypothetical protein